MHLMEAFTTLYELTGAERHRRALEQVDRAHLRAHGRPGHRLRHLHVRPRLDARSNLQLGTVWGSDRFDPAGKPPEITSYGHNIELAWLYLHARRRALAPRGRERAGARARPRARPRRADLPPHGRARRRSTSTAASTSKARATVRPPTGKRSSGSRPKRWSAFSTPGCSSATTATSRPSAWSTSSSSAASCTRRSASGTPSPRATAAILRAYLGHSWKICYHTVRATCLVVEKLRKIV